MTHTEKSLRITHQDGTQSGGVGDRTALYNVAKEAHGKGDKVEVVTSDPGDLQELVPGSIIYVRVGSKELTREPFDPNTTAL